MTGSAYWISPLAIGPVVRSLMTELFSTLSLIFSSPCTNDSSVAQTYQKNKVFLRFFLHFLSIYGTIFLICAKGGRALLMSV